MGSYRRVSFDDDRRTQCFWPRRSAEESLPASSSTRLAAATDFHEAEVHHQNFSCRLISRGPKDGGKMLWFLLHGRKMRKDAQTIIVWQIKENCEGTEERRYAGADLRASAVFSSHRYPHFD